MKKIIMIIGLYLVVLIGGLSFFGYAIGLEGSDFQNQYIQYLNYFSELYDQYHILFPHFVVSFGLIQNAGQFIYYGLFNPVFIIQRLLGIDGLVYLSLQYIFVIILTFYFSYKVIINHVKSEQYAIIGALFVCGNSYLINSLTYQIVFSNYLPIFLIGMLAIYNRKRVPLLMCMMLIYNFNFLMAVAVFFAYLLYGYYAKRSLKEIIVTFILSSLLSLYIILPVFYTIITSARNSLSSLVPITVQLYGARVLNYFSFSFLPLILLFTFTTSKANNKKLLLVILGIVLLPIASFITSLGTEIMLRYYVLMIPFIGILSADIFANIKQVRYFNQKFIIILALALILSMYAVIIPSTEVQVHLIFYCVALVCYYLALLFEYNNFSQVSLILVVIATLLNITAFTQISKFYVEYQGHRVTSETNQGLAVEDLEQFEDYKNEFNLDASQISIYASLINGNYINFMYDFVQMPTSFFPNIGYIYQGGQLTDAIFGISPSRPMIYANVNTCNNSQELSAEQRTLNLLDNDFTSDGNQACKQLVADHEFKYDKMKLNKSKLDKLQANSDQLSKYITFVSFTVPTDEGAIALKIDGQENSYTPSVKFYSHPTFSYYLDGNQNYEIKASDDFKQVEVTNVEIKLYEKNKLIDKYKSTSRVYPTELKLNQNDGEITFNLDLDTDSWLISKIPYDPAYQVIVNGKYVKTEKINDSFLGAKIKAGSNQIVIKYRIPMLKLGVGLSFSFGLILIIWRKFRKGKNEKN